ncbi:MAG: PVC-type heme-binding CxxCH protein [Bryobacteraceae bacterium]
MRVPSLKALPLNRTHALTRVSARVPLAIGALGLCAAVVWGQGFPPGEAVSRMKVLEGFKVKLVASEPEIRQPILVKFDPRGRLWVIQYLQYPNPAGLKRVKVDRYSRTTYDRIPEPPPKGPRGADRITILEDTDGDGKADKFKDFVTGLNLATGLAIGHGGVFVMQVPYLLFYPDRNHDDAPDSDPEVLLSGFGMEDAQSLANHLTWGPDGWLYGLNGSTATCRVRGIEFQQGVWRYHPVTKQFELFAEGGGNIYGLAFDANGNLFYSSNGASLFWHAVQGAYYQKSFGKHGPLHNPYAYGYFPHVKHNGVPGGHVVLGGLIYSGESFPDRFRETFIGGNFLGRSVSWWDVKPLGSTFQATLGKLFFDASDKWFCPTDLAQAADGSVYVCDFHDERTAHPDPDAPWDKSNGRVYRVEAEGTKPVPEFDLDKLSSRDLVGLLTRRNRWYADQARVILAARRDPSTHPALRDMAQSRDPQTALQGLWGLQVSGGFTESTALKALDHPYEYLRSWTVRLLADEKKVSRPIARKLAQMSRTEPSVVVRAQLAASAKRLPAADALPILGGVWDQNKDAADPFVPWLMWWALENKAVSDIDLVAREMARPEAVASRTEDARRLIRRWAAEGTPRTYDACARLLKVNPQSLLAALDQGLSERAGMPVAQDTGAFARFQSVAEQQAAGRQRTFAPVKGALLEAVRAAWAVRPSEPARVRLAMRSGIPEAGAEALRVVKDRAAQDADRVAMLEVLSEVGEAAAVPQVLPLLDEKSDSVRSAALGVLGRFEDARITQALVAHHNSLPPPLRGRAQDILISRASSAGVLLRAVDQGTIAHDAISTDRLKRVAALHQPALDSMVRKHWGNIGQGTAEEKLATVRRLSNDLRAAAGNMQSGKRLFFQHCGMCHKLFNEGGTLGMDLTPANRGDRLYLLTQIVDPGVFIRKEYMTMQVKTRDGRVISGLVAEEDGAGVMLNGANYEKTKIAKSDIASMEESSVSMMPEGILEKLNPQQLRDLFAYLELKK